MGRPVSLSRHVSGDGAKVGQGKDSLFSRKSKALDLGDLVEESGNSLLADVERQVANEQGITRGTDGIAVLLGAVSSTARGVVAIVGGLLGSHVQAQIATLELGAALGFEGRLGSLGVGEVDVAETTGAASLLIVDDTGTDQAFELLECVIEDIVINSPAKVANPDSGAVLVFLIISFGFLGSSLLGLILGLSLLARGLRLGLLLSGLGLGLAGIAVASRRRIRLRARIRVILSRLLNVSK